MTAKKKSSSGKKKSSSKKKAPSAKKGKASAAKSRDASRRGKPSAERSDVAAGAAAEAATILPIALTADFAAQRGTPEECIVWRDGDVHQRIRTALSVWSGFARERITSGTTLGQLAVGTGAPWNEGNQGRLVQATNAQDVFQPFAGTKMEPPSVLLPPSTTVASWEKVVWRLQNPQTFCFVFGS